MTGTLPIVVYGSIDSGADLGPGEGVCVAVRRAPGVSPEV